MKIGIITFHDCTNYGAVLQAYALWKAISDKMECAVELIDYRNPNLSDEVKIDRIKNDKSLKGLIKRIYALPYMEKKYELFGQFIEKNIIISDEKYDAESIMKSNKCYSHIIFGSDQVWNLKLTNDDYNYFGEFAINKKKISYAASLGGWELKQDEEKAISLLKEFIGISVREYGDVVQVKEILKDADIKHVPDPTVLIDREVWRNLEVQTKIPKDYILLYLISPQKRDFVFASQLSKKTKMPVLYITYSYHNRFGVNNLKDISPENFLYLLDNASYVVTNSFHGTILSMNLNTDFYWQVSPEKGKANNRTQEVLKRYGLENRIIDEKSIDIPEKVRDWSLVNTKLKEEREKGFAFIEEVLRK